ncbi:SapC protein [Ectothiorhodospira mobilis]|uniref:SapC protein n=1 Tax=Ectothiorhodospira mobilis TaxID=195064 RepID=A0A1I4SXJ6_ECTMO|nr:SapC family protein [Ectothiorhodospira mobilis]SFM69125.1 SapC protein [Ectothiorhodospira mobilis]
MTHWQAISRNDHAQTRYRPRDKYHFAQAEQVAPVLLAELPKLLPHYTLGFIAMEQGYQPVVLLSLDGQRNLYLAPSGDWLGTYVPAAMRGYPFRLAENSQGDKVFCIAREHLTDDPAADPLFDEQGQLSEPVVQTWNFLKQCEQNRQATLAATQVLNKAGVIEPWPLQIQRPEGQEPFKLNGLHRISEQALNALDPEQYARLRGAPMALAHAQLFSTHQVSELVKRAEWLSKGVEAQKPKDPLADLSADDLFGQGEELSFRFDH